MKIVLLLIGIYFTLTSCSYFNQDNCMEEDFIDYLSKDSSFNFSDVIKNGYPMQIKIFKEEICIQNNENDSIYYYIFNISDKKLLLKVKSPSYQITSNHFSFDTDYIYTMINDNGNKFYRFDRNSLEMESLYLPGIDDVLPGEFEVYNQTIIFKNSLNGVVMINTVDNNYLRIDHIEHIGSAQEQNFDSEMNKSPYVYITKESNTNKKHSIDLFKINLNKLTIEWSKELAIHIGSSDPLNPLKIKYDADDSVVIVGYDAYLYTINSNTGDVVGKYYLNSEMSDMHVDIQNNSIKLFAYPLAKNISKMILYDFDYASDTLKPISKILTEKEYWSIFNFGEITIFNLEPPNLDAYCMDGSKIAKIIEINCKDAELVRHYKNPFTGQSLMEFKKVIYYRNN